MVSTWYFVANYLLPVPLVLFVLLSVPLPREARKGVHIFASKVFDLKIVSFFKLLHVAITVSVLSLIGAIRQELFAKQLADTAPYATPNQELAVLSRRWRSERNVWIAAFTVAAWLGVAGLYREVTAHDRLRDKFAALKAKADAVDLAELETTSEPPVSKAAAELKGLGTSSDLGPSSEGFSGLEKKAA